MLNHLFVGDLHGDLAAADRAIDAARSLDATIIQAGDWGFLWPSPGGDQVDDLEYLLDASDVHMYFIDGNHDWHPELRRSGPRLSEHITYMSRGSTMVDADGTSFLFLGGAPSIDREFRTPGQTWWPEEEITDADVALALAYPGPADVMVTHDSPVIPDGFSDNVGSPWFRGAGPASRRRLLQVVQHHNPKLLVHGHWHRRYTRQYGGTVVEGLDCNNAKHPGDLLLPWSRSTSWGWL